MSTSPVLASLSAWVAFVTDTLLERLDSEATSSAERLWRGAPATGLEQLQREVSAAKAKAASVGVSADEFNRMSAALQQLQHVETRVQSATRGIDRCRRDLHGEELRRALLAVRHLQCLLQGDRSSSMRLLHRFEQSESVPFPADPSQLASLPHASSGGIAIYSAMVGASDALLACILDVFHICMLAGALAGWNGPDPQAFARCMTRFDSFVRSLVGALRVEEQTEERLEAAREESHDGGVIGGGEDEELEDDVAIFESEPQPSQPAAMPSSAILLAPPSSSSEAPQPPPVFAAPTPMAPPSARAELDFFAPPPSQAQQQKQKQQLSSPVSLSTPRPMAPTIPPSLQSASLRSSLQSQKAPQQPVSSSSIAVPSSRLSTAASQEPPSRRKKSVAADTVARFDDDSFLPSSPSAATAEARPAHPPSQPPLQTAAQAPAQRLRDVQRQVDEVRAVMNENIAPILQRGEKIEDLVQQTEELHESAFVFRKMAAKRRGFFSSLFSRDPSAPPAKPKKPKTKIDNVFADLENTFNGLSSLLSWATRWRTSACGCGGAAADALWMALCVFPLVMLVYLGVSAFTLIIMLPAIFLLLVTRTQTIERKVETGFAVRQEVLAQESVQEKSVRFLNLMLRGLPVASFLVGWPILSVYYIIPHYRSSPRVDTATIGVFLVAMLLLQVLGTVRSGKSFLEKMRAQHEEKAEAFRKAAVAAGDGGGGGDAAAKQAEPAEPSLNARPQTSAPVVPLDGAHAEKPAQLVVDPAAPLPATFWSESLERAGTFRWRNVHNLVALLSLLVEAVQLVLFSVQTLDAEGMQAQRDASAATPAPASDDSSSSDDDSPGGGSFGPHFIPYLFVNFAGFLSNNLLYVYAFTSFAVVALLLLLFLAQFFKELLAYARAPSKAEANQIFFFSFVGSIVYGHGEVRRVSSLVSNLVALLSDTLFLVVCGKLLAVFTCVPATDSQPALLLIDPRVVCWEGDHQWLACIALIAFGYYLPLSTMISPMLVESEAEVEVEGAAAGAASSGSQTAVAKLRKKDVHFVQPFLSLLVVSKCALLVSSSFFGHNDAITTVVSSMAVSLALLLVTIVWLRRSNSAVFRSAHWWRGGHFLADPHMHIQAPCAPDPVNIVRLLSFVGGILGSGVAILAYEFPRALGGDKKYYLLAGVLALLLLLGSIWKARSGVPLHALLAELAAADPHASSATGSKVTIHVSAGDEDALPPVKRNLDGRPLLQSDAALVRSSSEEGAIEMDELQPADQRANAAPQSVLVHQLQSQSQAQPASAPFLLSISAIQGVQFENGMWVAAALAVAGHAQSIAM